jgi:hypothetical protein
MSITSGVPVPTSYKKLQENKIFNIHARLLAVWAVFVFLYGTILIQLWTAGISYVELYIGIGLVLGSIIFVIARDVQTLDKTYWHILLIFRILKNKNITKKYIEPLDDLKKVVPIDTVEESGLIRYLDGASGVLVRYNPPRVADGDYDNHSLKIKNVINSLYGDFSFQFLCNSIVDKQNPLSKATMESMKFKDTPPQITTHLHSLYEESITQRDSIDWEFLLLVSLPVTEKTAEAEKVKTAFMSGLSKELARTGVFSRIVEERNEVIRLLRGYLC